MEKVILSAPIIIGTGTFSVRHISAEEAMEFAAGAVNYCGHQTVKMVGINPAASRRDCTGYDQALIVSPKERLEFGREYTKEEIEEIGVDYILIYRT